MARTILIICHLLEVRGKLLKFQLVMLGAKIIIEISLVLIRLPPSQNSVLMNGRPQQRLTILKTHFRVKTFPQLAHQLSKIHQTTKCNSCPLVRDTLVFNIKVFNILMMISSKCSEINLHQEEREVYSECRESSKSWMIMATAHLKFKNFGKLYVILESKCLQKRPANYLTCLI